MRFKRPADEDSNGKYPGWLRWNAFDLGCADTVMHAVIDSMHLIHLRKLDHV